MLLKSKSLQAQHTDDNPLWAVSTYPDTHTHTHTHSSVHQQIKTPKASPWISCPPLTYFIVCRSSATVTDLTSCFGVRSSSHLGNILVPPRNLTGTYDQFHANEPPPTRLYRVNAVNTATCITEVCHCLRIDLLVHKSCDLSFLLLPKSFSGSPVSRLGFSFSASPAPDLSL